MPRGRFKIETASAAMWEYMIVEEANPVSLQERLGALAEDGWDMVLLRRRVQTSHDSEPTVPDHV